VTAVITAALAALLSQARVPAVDVVAERQRLEAMAAAIAGAVEEADELASWIPGAGELHADVLPLPFTGSRAAEATALALVAIAAGESRLAADVADCRRVGSDHPSITSWQLHGAWSFGPYSRTELCRSTRLAAERALWILSHHAAKCATPMGAFLAYASGSCSVRSAAGEEHCHRWERLCAAAGIVASCDMKEVR
jgi:hypothetical protein